MSRVSLRLLQVGLLYLCLAFVSACGAEDELTCESTADCADGMQCVDGMCAAVALECTEDDHCEHAYQRCSSAGVCVERTSCEGNDQCAPGNVCASGTCVERQCTTNNDCPTANACNDGVCQPQALQCTSVGQDCEAGRPTRDGFVCQNIGEGTKCYNRCSQGTGTNAQTGAPMTVYECSAGSICIDRTACMPSECSGIISGQDTCDQKAEANPSQFPHGATCTRVVDTSQNYATICMPAGQRAEGEECASGSSRADQICQPGLMCRPFIASMALSQEQELPSVCVKPCDRNNPCDNGLDCIGDDIGMFQNGGFCGEGCTPYDVDARDCSDGKTCLPVSNNDGLCALVADNTKEPYSACTPGSDTDECPNGTWCMAMSEGEGRCLPLCNPTLPTAAERDATCPGPNPQSFIRLLNMVEGLEGVDVQIDGQSVASGLNPGDIAADGEFISLVPGEKTVELVVDGEVVFTTTYTLTGNEAHNLVILYDAEPAGDEEDEAAGVQILTIAEPRNAPVAHGETTELRVVHGIVDGGEVDVIAVRAGSDIENVALQFRMATELGFGVASSYAALETDTDPEAEEAVGYDIYVFPAAERTPGSEVVVFHDVKVETGVVGSLYLVGTVDEDDAHPLELHFAEHRKAATSRVLGGFCRDLLAGQQEPVQGLGVCFETCDDSSQLGAGVCSGGGVNACQPVGAGTMWCFPTGARDLGESCTETSECGDGLFCDMLGTGVGTCQRYCEHGPNANPLMACDGDQICAPMAGYSKLGTCRTGCTPDSNFRDDSCPTDQKSCYAPIGDVAYCQPSGDVAVGQKCDTPAVQNCAPGAVCAKNVPTFSGMLTEPFNDLEQGEESFCRPLCQPFKAEGEPSDCPTGMACSMILPGPEFSVELGHCVESGPTVPSLETCARDDKGKMCGDNAYCIDGQGEEGMCVRFCDYNTRKGCFPGESCSMWDNSEEAIANGETLLLGVYGICRP